jgi:hypothetical protein
VSEEGLFKNFEIQQVDYHFNFVMTGTAFVKFWNNGLPHKSAGPKHSRDALPRVQDDREVVPPKGIGIFASLTVARRGKPILRQTLKYGGQRKDVS